MDQGSAVPSVKEFTTTPITIQERKFFVFSERINHISDDLKTLSPSEVPAPNLQEYNHQDGQQDEDGL